ncbi:MAG: Mur ligase family protein [Candidatus Berkelbacteria bacterium]
MKNILLKLIESYLQFLARTKVRWAKPKIVAITGSYGKTSAKEAVYFVLSKKFGSDVGKNWGNMNSVLGLPLAVLGLKKYSFGIGLVGNIIQAKWNFLFYKLPKILVLEMGIDKPGEMSQLLSVAIPDIAIVTGISETHLEGLKNLQGVKKEKSLLVESLSKKGIAITNANDENSVDLKVPAEAKKITFGSADGDISASNTEVTTSGTKFDLKIFDKKISINSKLIGQHSIQSLLIAAATANQFDIDPEEIKQSLEQIVPENGRMNIIEIENQITIIDDSYNSNPKSAEESLSALLSIKHDGRKIAILGNMNELGGYTKDAHIRVGKAAVKVVDILIAVGDNAKYLVDGAKDAGLAAEKNISFATTEALIAKIDGIIRPSDLILVKGSQNRVRLERLVKYLLKDDELAAKNLVRQEKKWQDK